LGRYLSENSFVIAAKLAARLGEVEAGIARIFEDAILTAFPGCECSEASFTIF
jgi:hypothetical protein